VAIAHDVSGWELVSAPPGPDVSADAIRACLSSLRRHFDMDAAFVARFRSERRVVEYVDKRAAFCPLHPGDDDALEVTLCGWVAHGRLPELMPDVRALPEAAQLPTPRGLPVGSQISVPLHRASGELLGTLCCFGHEADPSLRRRDLELVRMFAGVVERHLEALTVDAEASCRRGRVEDVLRHGGPRIAMQPIVHVDTGRLRAYEALPRFPEPVGWEPARWFAEAAQLGLGSALETSTLRAALRSLPLLPPGALLAVNVSAATLLHPEVVELLTGEHAQRLVVELTERTGIEDLDDLADSLAELRTAGALLALDDAGSSWAGLEHIERLQPEVLKLQAELVRDIAVHPARQAMVEAMLGLSRRIGAEVVAEGVRSPQDLYALADLGVDYAQGDLIGPAAFTVA